MAELNPKGGTRCRKTRTFLLYHWAPSSRRKSILKKGLLVKQLHAAHSKGWQADYLCFSDSPSYAWALSGHTKRRDLWMVWSNSIPDLCYRSDEVGKRPSEYRTARSLPPSKIWFVGTRRQA